MTVAVVIPALDEEDTLPGTLASVAHQPGPKEAFVIDGGSADGTRAVAESHDGVRFMGAQRGRACQMNSGAAQSCADVLLFLHADTRLPEGALDHVRAAIRGGAVAGCFRLRFDRGGFWLWLWTRPVWMRWHRWAFGDRALFVRRDVFEAVGGFPNQPLFEDLDLVRAVRRHGRFAFLTQSVTTSARRFVNIGTLQQQLRNWALWGAWLLGLSPHSLKRFYPDHTEI